jgi:hypothetical protein
VNKTLTGILGAAQGLFGLLGTAAGGVSQAVGTSSSGNIINLVSGAALGALGFGTSGNTQKVGVSIVSVLNALVGILGLSGVELGNLNLGGTGSNIINIGVAVLGFVFTFLKTKKAA